MPWRMIAGAVLLPVSVAVYFIGGMTLFGSSRPSPGWFVLAFGWAFLTLCPGVLAAVWLMTRD